MLTLLLVMMSVLCHGQTIDRDKQMHLVAGAAITAGTSLTVYAMTKNTKKAIIAGVVTGVSASIAKELIYDKAMKKGTPETMDFLASFVGVSFSIPFTLCVTK